MDLLTSAILGLIQGITEWLPVSSSGHLVIAQRLLGVAPPLFFDVALHVGTLLAALWFLRKEAAKILRAVARADFKSKDGKLAKLIAIASVPTALLGYFLHDAFASLFAKPEFVGAALIASGVWLYAAAKHKVVTKKITGPKALLVGLAQGIAVAPGISRSGATIGAAALLGVNKVEATRFSFLLAIPAIAGAALYEATKTVFVPELVWSAAAGAALAAISGYYAMGALLEWLKQGKLQWFAEYCVVAGALVLLLT